MAADEPVPEPSPEAEAIYLPPTEFTPHPTEGPPAFPAWPAPWAPPAVVKPRPPHPNFWWALLWMVALLLVTQIIIPVGVLIPVIVFQAITAPNLNAYLAELSVPDSPALISLLAPVLLGIQVGSLLFAWLALRLVAGRDWARKVALRRPGLAHLGLTLLIFPAVFVVGQGMAELAQLLKLPHLFDMDKTVRALGLHWPAWLGVLLIGVGPGLWEELWCRGFLGRGLVGHYGVVAGVALTSLLFGAMHIEPHQVFYAPLIGAALHFVYLTTRSLWLPMLLHALNNSLTMLAVSNEPLTARVLGQLERLGAAHPAFLYTGGVVLLLTVGYALYQSRARLVAADGSGPPPWRPAYPGVEYPPPDSGTAVAHPRPSFAAILVAAYGVAVFAAACYLAAVVG